MKPLILLLCATLSSTACSKEENMEHTRPGYDSMGMPIAEHRPEVRINPNRKNRYEVTVDFKDAPGGFELVEGTELHYAWNCKYTTARFQGATASPDLYYPVPFMKTGETTYTGIFYDDTPLDEDYYGQGVCHWTLENFSIYFSANKESKTDTVFDFSIDRKDFEQLSTNKIILKMKKHYLKKVYPIRDDQHNQTQTIRHTRSFQESEIKERNLIYDDFFPVTVTIRKL